MCRAECVCRCDWLSAVCLPKRWLATQGDICQESPPKVRPTKATIVLLCGSVHTLPGQARSAVPQTVGHHGLFLQVVHSVLGHFPLWAGGQCFRVGKLEFAIGSPNCFSVPEVLQIAMSQAEPTFVVVVDSFQYHEHRQEGCHRKAVGVGLGSEPVGWR